MSLITEQLDTWEGLCDAARQAVERGDECRWELGDIAVRCERLHGEHSIAELAKACNTGRSSLYAYARTASLFERDDRIQYANLGYGHYQAASSLDDRDTALAFLSTCADEDWTVDQARREARKARGAVPREVLLDMEGTVDELIARLMRLASDAVVRARVTAKC